VNGEPVRSGLESWICCQLGAREQYAVPRALQAVRALDCLATDAWVPPRSILRIVGEQKSEIRDRWHEELKGAPVASFNWSLIAFEILARARRLRGWPLILARNDWFQRKVVTCLSSSQLSVAGSRPILFAYSYAAQDIFRFAKAQGWKTVLGQIDPGPVEEEIVRTEHEIHPEFVSDWRPAPGKYWQNWRKELELADKILVNSDWARTALERSGVNEQKLAVIPLAYEPPPNNSPTTHKYPDRFTPERPLRVLFLGQVNLRKGIARLLEAAHVLRNEPVEFWMVGPRQCRPPEELRRLKNVRWFGRVAHANAAQYYRNADIFILPTLSDGFALTQLEAQAHGLPVIASRRCGEVVRDGINGIVLEEPTTDPIVATLQLCLRNPDQLAQFSENATVGERFSLSCLSANLCTHVKSCVAPIMVI
jgi:glycosyltransferase involved in cell wall biosynthesis